MKYNLRWKLVNALWKKLTNWKRCDITCEKKERLAIFGGPWIRDHQFQDQDAFGCFYSAD